MDPSQTSIIWSQLFAVSSNLSVPDLFPVHEEEIVINLYQQNCPRFCRLMNHYEMMLFPDYLIVFW